MYGTLDRLVAKGLLTSSRVAADGPSRRRFEISLAGARALAETRATPQREEAERILQGGIPMRSGTLSNSQACPGRPTHGRRVGMARRQCLRLRRDAVPAVRFSAARCMVAVAHSHPDIDRPLVNGVVARSDATMRRDGCGIT